MPRMQSSWMSYTQMPAVTARLSGLVRLTSGRTVARVYSLDVPDSHLYHFPMIVSCTFCHNININCVDSKVVNTPSIYVNTRNIYYNRLTDW